MTRISLKEAYDNRDVIAQIARLNDIIEDLPNPDLTNVVLKTGNQIIDGVKQFNDQVVLVGGMDLSALGPTTITGDLDISGDLQVDGNIVQTGAAYETHAEQVFSKNDYLVMRDEAVSALPAGSYSGLQVKKYDGTNDCRLVVDNQGVARVGDINDEQPLATRDEVADMTSGALVKWDGVNKKLIAPDSDIGDDTYPVKVVDGVPVAVSGELQSKLTDTTVVVDSTIHYRQYGKVVVVTIENRAVSGSEYVSGVPVSNRFVTGGLVFANEAEAGHIQIAAGETRVRIKPTAAGNVYGSITYITE